MVKSEKIIVRVVSLDEIARMQNFKGNPRKLRMVPAFWTSFSQFGWQPTSDDVRGVDLPVIYIDESNTPHAVRGAGRLGSLKEKLADDKARKTIEKYADQIQAYVTHDLDFASSAAMDNDALKQAWDSQAQYHAFVMLRRQGKSVLDASRMIGKKARWQNGELIRTVATPEQVTAFLEKKVTEAALADHLSLVQSKRSAMLESTDGKSSDVSNDDDVKASLAALEAAMRGESYIDPAKLLAKTLRDAYNDALRKAEKLDLVQMFHKADPVSCVACRVPRSEEPPYAAFVRETIDANLDAFPGFAKTEKHKPHPVKAGSKRKGK